MRSEQKTEMEVCLMCGAAAEDVWQTRPARPVMLLQRPRPGDVSQVCTFCDECEEGLRGLPNCNEGLQNTSPMKPDRVHLLSQVRRAMIDDQRAVLDWLLQKFNLTAIEESK